MNADGHLEQVYSLIPRSYYDYAMNYADNLMNAVLKHVDGMEGGYDMRSDLDCLSGMIINQSAHASVQHCKALHAIVYCLRAIACRTELCGDHASWTKDLILSYLKIEPCTNPKLSARAMHLRDLVAQLNDHNDTATGVKSIVHEVRALIADLRVDIFSSQPPNDNINFPPLKQYDAASTNTAKIQFPSTIVQYTFKGPTFQPGVFLSYATPATTMPLSSPPTNHNGLPTTEVATKMVHPVLNQHPFSPMIVQSRTMEESATKEAAIKKETFGPETKEPSKTKTTKTNKAPSKKKTTKKCKVATTKQKAGVKKKAATKKPPARKSPRLNGMAGTAPVPDADPQIVP